MSWRAEMLSEEQVMRIANRAKSVGISRAGLLDRFTIALKQAGSNHSPGAAKMRLDRVFNPKMRRPMSESTKIALAQALQWTVTEFESVIGCAGMVPPDGRGASYDALPAGIRELARDLKSAVRTLHADAEKLESLLAKYSKPRQKK